MTTTPTTTEKHARVPVVIAIEPDGFIRVYAGPGADVRFVQVVPTSTPHGRTAAEEYALARLPLPHRQIAFDARYSKGCFYPYPITGEEELHRRIEVAMIHEALA